ncbi:hydrogenase maturation nickel metallochaperone HypA/HybF [Dissulfurimicrobium hydrothermale]|uniref:hydrogenase maturation nickel metallochaperone HypA/HybF n=1 Tax=Dissulfurimicrobium hydrothermale TaxID=1750598 RepID=UPI001EDC5725|nr:hydrogenase maturation nickel metallochaperone HypA [Dissulfurimicrobium hydrothermale]UKL13591.1 hydrogenase maturation nickel metallochaperone HypA [Dissulfurimicrobium hydrothermale]
MHELSLAQAVIDEIVQLAREHKADKVLKVRVMIGALSGVVKDSFAFGFKAMAMTNEITKGAALVIETPAVPYRCIGCGHEFKTEGGRPDCCPRCGARDVFPQGGDELLLMQVEME